MKSGLKRLSTRPTSRGAFTLLEMLVVMATVGLMMSILLPALNSARATAKTLECASNMRSVTTDFALFAEGHTDDGRGDSNVLGRARFWINDFQDRLYRIDEFWDRGTESRGRVASDTDLMMCPAGPVDLVKRKGYPCSVEAVGPAENVSLAINMRLFRAVVEFKGRRVLAPAAATHVSRRTLQHPYAPLTIDVDGAEAAQRGIDPFYIAPPVPGQEGPYSEGRYWAPSKRHNGKVNVAFVGGHVLSSVEPEKERWDWAHQAEAGR